MNNVRVVQEVYGAFGRGDIPAVLGAFHPKIEWREAESNPYQPSGKPWIGPEAILENLFVRLGAEWDAFTVHPRQFHDAGGTIVVELRYTGTYKATRKKLDAQACHVWAIRDGKIHSFQQYVDTAQLQDVMKAR
ncbi:MAG: nuclear transport factor 2 family protein [Planctomycetota bacterium]